MQSCTPVQVTVDCNMFRGKTHVNPISRLVEPIANAIEHGKATRVDVALERTSGCDTAPELYFSGACGAMRIVGQGRAGVPAARVRCCPLRGGKRHRYRH